MGIYSEQNILGDPTLSLATRPGSDQKAADYAFNAPMVYRIAEGNFISSFTSPASYSIDKVMAEVTKNNDTGEQTGINDESITFPEAATQYGPAAGNKLADTQQTNLGAAAEVVAGNSEVVESPSTQSSMTQMESYYNKQTSPSGPEASGGPNPGYDNMNQYYINKASAATPAVEGPSALDAPSSPGGASDTLGGAPSNRPHGPSNRPHEPAGGGNIAPKTIVMSPLERMYSSTPTPAKTNPRSPSGGRPSRSKPKSRTPSPGGF